MTATAPQLAAAKLGGLIRPPRRVYLESGSVNWRTPASLFEAQIHRWGPFWVDVAAASDNTLCPHFFDEEQDGLAHSWKPPTLEIARLHGRGAWGNFPYTIGEEPCPLPHERCRKRRCIDPGVRNYRGGHLLKRTASLGEWIAYGRDQALAWGGPVCTLVPAREDTQWWRRGIRCQPSGAGRYLGGLAHPNGGPAAAYFPEEYPAAEWKEYRWELLTVDIVIIEGRLFFGGQGAETGGATFPSAIVTFYRPGMRR